MNLLTKIYIFIILLPSNYFHVESTTDKGNKGQIFWWMLLGTHSLEPPTCTLTYITVSPDNILNEYIWVSIYHDAERLLPGLQSEVIDVIL